MKRSMAPALIALAICGCHDQAAKQPAELTLGHVTVQDIARSDRQWTGVTVSRTGRIFVNYPRWSPEVPVSVAELKRRGDQFMELPFPNEQMQQWEPNKDAHGSFVCVQSVVADDADGLWIVDAGSPMMAGVIPGGAKVIHVDLKSNRVVKTYDLEEPVISGKSYLNDIRIDRKRGFAYLTDSGTGGIIVLELSSGKPRRLLGDHPSTKSEGLVPIINGKPWTRPDGSKPDIHSDGIALSTDGKYLYYHALTGKTLYRIETRYLRDESLPATEVGSHVETLGKTGQCDGMEYGPGGTIYLTQLENNAITRWVPSPPGEVGGHVEIIVQSLDLAWPDTFAFGPDGSLYVTTSQIHLQPDPPGPYRLFKLTPRKN